MKTIREVFGLVFLISSMMLVAGGGAASAQGGMEFEEYVVNLDNGIVGTVVEPQAAGPVPAVLMLHGFASLRDEVGDMYKRLAAALGARGIASLRIDFRGWGESAGGMENSTVTGMVEDAATAHAFLLAQPFVDPARVGLVGFSLGGAVALVSAGQNPDWYQSVAIWSWGGSLADEMLGGFTQEQLDTAAVEGQVTVDLGWREVTLGKGFFESLTAFDVEAEFLKYPNSFLVVAGTEDFSGAYVTWFMDNAQGELKAAYLVKGADHIYAVLTDDQTMANAVIETTADWFVMSLK